MQAQTIRVHSQKGSVFLVFISRSTVVIAGFNLPTQAGRHATVWARWGPMMAVSPSLDQLAHCRGITRIAWCLMATRPWHSVRSRMGVATSPGLTVRDYIMPT
jgi:hypothetical protein